MDSDDEKAQDESETEPVNMNINNITSENTLDNSTNEISSSSSSEVITNEDDNQSQSSEKIVIETEEKSITLPPATTFTTTNISPMTNNETYQSIELSTLSNNDNDNESSANQENKEKQIEINQESTLCDNNDPNIQHSKDIQLTFPVKTDDESKEIKEEIVHSSTATSGAVVVTKSPSSSTPSTPSKLSNVLKMDGKLLDKFQFIQNKIIQKELDSTDFLQLKDILLHLLLNGPYSPEKNCLIYNESVVQPFLSAVNETPTETKLDLWVIFSAIVKSNRRNIIVCVDAQASFFIIKMLPNCPPGDLCNVLLDLLKCLVSFSITVKELAALFRLLKSSSHGKHWSTHALDLLEVLHNMPTHLGPEDFFNFPGKIGSTLQLPPITKWPHQAGWSFNIWFNLDESLTGENNTKKTYLYCFRTSKGLGYNCYFDNNCLYLMVMKAGGRGLQSSLRFAFQANRWYMLTLVYVYNRWSKSEIRCYVDGQLIAHLEQSWSLNTNEVFEKCFIGSNAEQEFESLFCGQISSLYGFADVLSPQQISAIYSLGPAYKGQFKFENEAPSHLSQTERKVVYEGSLHASVMFSYNPVACDSQLCLNQAPKSNSSVFQHSPHAMMIGDVKPVLTRQIHSTLHSLGGVAILYPLFGQLDCGQDDNHKTQDISALLFGLLCDLIQNHTAIQQQVLQTRGFLVIRYHLENASVQHVSEALLLRVMTLARNLIQIVATYPSGAESLGMSLLRQLFDHLIFYPSLWIRGSEQVQMTLYQFIASEFLKSAPIFNGLRRVSSVLLALNTLKTYYWITPPTYLENASEFSSTNISRPDTKDLTNIRTSLLVFIKQLMMRGDGVLEEQLQPLLNFLSTVEEDNNLGDVLYITVLLMHEAPQTMVPTFDKLEGIKTVFQLLLSPDESIRIYALKLLGMFLCRSTQKRKSDAMLRYNLFTLIGDRLLLHSPHLTMQTYNTLFEILTEKISLEIYEHKHSEPDSAYRFENPMLLKVIAQLLQRSKPCSELYEVQIIFLTDLITMCSSSRENRRTVLQLSVWQDWMLTLAPLIPRDASEIDLRDMLFSIFRLLLHHAIKYEHGGWRVWIDTLAILHTRISYENFKRKMYEEHTRTQAEERKREKDGRGEVDLANTIANDIIHYLVSEAIRQGEGQQGGGGDASTSVESTVGMNKDGSHHSSQLAIDDVNSVSGRGGNVVGGVGPSTSQSSPHSSSSKINTTTTTTLNGPAKKVNPRFTSANTSFRIPEFYWSNLHLKMLNELLYSIENDLEIWKTQASASIMDFVNSPDNHVYVVNIIHLIAQLTDMLITSCGGLLPLLAAATSPSGDVDMLEQSQGLKLSESMSFLLRLVNLADLVIFASSQTLYDLEQEKNMPAGGILRLALRLVCTCAVRNTLECRYRALFGEELPFRVLDGSLLAELLTLEDDPSVGASGAGGGGGGTNGHGSSNGSISGSGGHEHLSLPQLRDPQTRTLYTLIQGIIPHSSEPLIARLQAENSPLRDSAFLLQEMDVNRLRAVIYRDMEETKQAQFLALAIVYFLSVLMVSKYRDILEPPDNKSSIAGSSDNISQLESPFNQSKNGENNVPIDRSSTPTLDDAEKGNVGKADGADEEGNTSATQQQQQQQLPSVQIPAQYRGSVRGTKRNSYVSDDAGLTERLQTALGVVAPLLRDIFIDFSTFLSKTLIGSHGQELLSGGLIALKQSKSVIELVMLLCSQEWQNSLQKHAGLAFIELVNEGRLLAHSTRDHIVRVSNEAEFILNRMRADDVSKNTEFEQLCIHNRLLRNQEERQCSHLINAAKRRDWSQVQKRMHKIMSAMTAPNAPWGPQTTQQTERLYYRLDTWEDDSRRRRRFIPNPNGNNHPEATLRSDETTTLSHDSDNNIHQQGSVPKEILQTAISNASGVGGVNSGGGGGVTQQDLESYGVSDEELTQQQKSGGGPVNNNDNNNPTVIDRLEVQGQITLSTKCILIAAATNIHGTLSITKTDLYFEMDVEHPANKELDPKILHYVDHLHGKWHFSEIRAIFSRRYLHRNVALEIFVASRTAVMFVFSDQEIVKNVVQNLPRVGIGIKYNLPQTRSSSLASPRQILKLSNMTQRWQQREISNFDYLMFLNTISGRTFNDLNQYPIFPWVLCNYDCEELNLTDPSNYRDLSQPIGAINPIRKSLFQERYNTWDDDSQPAFHFGTHYSTAAFVFNYLVRIEPFTTLFLQFQGGKFDHADRAFHSIHQTWLNCQRDTSDVKELIPEFFYLPEMFRNSNGYNLGKTDDGNIVNDVQLPAWASSAEEFVRIHRQALESEFVSCQLHEWIDLIFGYKQRGPEAVRATNVFCHLTYENSVDWSKVSDPILREALEAQIRLFGQTPSQLLTEPHPPRASALHVSPLMFTPLAEDVCMMMKFLSNSPIVALSANTHPMLSAMSAVVAVTANHSYSVNRWNNQAVVNTSSVNNNSTGGTLSAGINLSAATTGVVVGGGSGVGGVGGASGVAIGGTSSSSSTLPTAPTNSSLLPNAQSKFATTSTAKSINPRSAHATPQEDALLPLSMDPILIQSTFSPKRYLGDTFDERLPARQIHFATTADNRTLFACGFWDKSFRAFSTDTNRLIQVVFGHHGVVTCLARSEGAPGQDCYIVTGGEDCTVMLWTWNARQQLFVGENGIPGDPPSPRAILTGHQEEISCVAISAELGLILSASLDNFVIHSNHGDLLRIMHLGVPSNLLSTDNEISSILSNNRHIGTTSFVYNHRPQQIQFTREGYIVVQVGASVLNVYSLNGLLLTQAKPLVNPDVADEKRKSQERDVILSLVLNRQGHYIIVGSQMGRLCVLRIYDLKLVYEFPQCDAAIRSLALSHDQRYVLAGLSSGCIVVFNIDFNQWHPEFRARYASVNV